MSGSEWEASKQANGRVYNGNDEEEFRRQVFENNMAEASISQEAITSCRASRHLLIRSYIWMVQDMHKLILIVLLVIDSVLILVYVVSCFGVRVTQLNSSVRHRIRVALGAVRVILIFICFTGRPFETFWTIRDLWHHKSCGCQVLQNC